MNDQLDQPKIRLDQYIVNNFKDINRSLAIHLIKDSKVKIDQEVIIKPSYKIKDNQKIKIDTDLLKRNLKTKLKLPIIYEDDDCIVIDKPAGILAHSKGRFNSETTIADWLKDKIDFDLGNRDGIVHRLDRGTSGVMILARTLKAQKWIQKQFADRKVKKEYIAIIGGHLATKEAVIDMPIERNPKKPQTFRVGINGKSAQTSYLVIKETTNYSLVELKPQTGRTHQLRVHLAKLGHPIVGDVFYDGLNADRLYLHARCLELILPSKQKKIFTSPLPDQFTNLLTADHE